MSEPRGPTTEELRARVLAQSSAADPRREGGEAGKPSNGYGVRVAKARPAERSTTPVEASPPVLLLERRCLACNREPGERMCDLRQRLEVAEASAK